MKRSARQQKPNKKYFVEEEGSSDGPKRKCGRSGCPATVPICFAGVSERCCGSSWTSRWYHVTLGEHFCNECFEHYYRSHKAGYADFTAWKRKWSAHARTEGSVVAFMMEQIVPYWVQCQKKECGKWRQLSRDVDLTPEFIRMFQCGSTNGTNNNNKKGKQDPCYAPQDERVHFVHSPLWLIQNKCTPYLKKSPAAPFLTAYYADGVGLSPTENAAALSKAEKKKLCPYVLPFPKADHPLHAFAVTPDMMTEVEIESFPLLAQECPYMYLAVRNLIMSLWTLNPKEWLTKEKCTEYLICRGLARVSCVEQLPQVLAFLTHHDLINQGLVTPPANLTEPFTSLHQGSSVLIVGAGASGLAAARLLSIHGVKVTVLEAKGCIGGRVCDQDVEGSTVSFSGQWLNGCVNNPVAVIAYQAGIDLEQPNDDCRLITEDGNVIEDSLDRRIEFHYNAILDIIAEWRKGREDKADVDLLTKFKEFHQQFISETQGFFTHVSLCILKLVLFLQSSWCFVYIFFMRTQEQQSTVLSSCFAFVVHSPFLEPGPHVKGVFSQEEEQVMEFHLSNLEFACGCSLDQLSSLRWDQNEEMPQFAGARTHVASGFGSILKKFADGLDVRLNTQVTGIDYTGSEVTVTTESGQNFSAQMVILSLPLAVLNSGVVTFQPALPDSKMKAIEAVGAGQVEKLILQFDQNFWSEKIKGKTMFGHVPGPTPQRGLFSIFHDVSKPQNASTSSKHTLVTYLVGQGLSLMHDQSDQEVVTKCVCLLREMFPEKDIPDPSWYHMTHWGRDPHIGMAYSYLPVGAPKNAHSNLAEEVDSRLFFAGEATHHQFPQTVAGAYLSGVREARKVLTVLEQTH
ncbi:lysine-specific histone demethylase 1B [Aplysia californica]|uniref:Lysine-specific histone demethylase 1B n=1 Tax=Aplysia californica TaxID=6500 RepID=A0ABM1W246_APLCA|nr:lysine-specific histone demethylase 1B [Aplysia californica]